MAISHFATEMPATRLDLRSTALRKEILATLACSRRGHLGSAFSLVEILRVLYDQVLRHRPAQPKWPGRDRCILSKGHGCLALYVILADKGFFNKSELKSFCQAGALLGGHPEPGIPGVEAATGSLGHGLSIGVGMALNARLEKADYRTFVILGDGECNEGSVWEAAMSAGKHALDALTVIIDANGMQSYGSTAAVQPMAPFAEKWRSFGFGCHEVDGHCVQSMTSLFNSLPFEKGKPNAVICHTVKAKGAAAIEHDPSWHHKSGISDAEIEMLAAELEKS